jgi:hypothetical protein
LITETGVWRRHVRGPFPDKFRNVVIGGEVEIGNRLEGKEGRKGRTEGRKEGRKND